MRQGLFPSFLHFLLDKSHNPLSSISSMASMTGAKDRSSGTFGEPGTASLLGLSSPRQLSDQSLEPPSPRVALYSISIYQFLSLSIYQFVTPPRYPISCCSNNALPPMARLCHGHECLGTPKLGSQGAASPTCKFPASPTAALQLS